MPRVLTFGQYVLYFWIAENGEPVHIHVAVRRPTEHATKFWLTAAGGCVLARDAGDIPQRDLRDLARLIALNHSYICKRWAERFGDDSLVFYC